MTTSRFPTARLTRGAVTMAVPGRVRAQRTSPPLGSAVRLALPVGVLVGLVALWQLLVQSTGVSVLVAPAPGGVLHALVQHRAELASEAMVTVKEAFAGLVLGTAVALVSAVAFTYSRLLRSSAYPLVLSAQAIPLVALAPILAIWLGTGALPKVVLAAFLAYTVTLVNMVKGMTSVEESQLELLHVLSARRTQELRLLRWPAALPFLFTSLKLAASAAVTAAIAAEYIGSLNGLGYLIQHTRKRLDTEYLWATILVTAVIGMGAYGLMRLVEIRVMRWQPGSRD